MECEITPSPPKIKETSVPQEPDVSLNARAFVLEVNGAASSVSALHFSIWKLDKTFCENSQTGPSVQRSGAYVCRCNAS
jgi:hypothetical protein